MRALTSILFALAIFLSMATPAQADPSFRVGHYSSGTSVSVYKVALGEKFVDEKIFSFHVDDNTTRLGVALQEGSFHAVDALAVAFSKNCLSYDRSGSVTGSDCVILDVNTYANFDFLVRREILVDGNLTRASIVGRQFAVWGCAKGLFSNRLMEILFEQKFGVSTTCSGESSVLGDGATLIALGQSSRRVGAVKTGVVAGATSPFKAQEYGSEILRIDFSELLPMFRRYPETVIVVRRSCLERYECAGKAVRLRDGLRGARKFISERASDFVRVEPYVLASFRIEGHSPLIDETRRRIRTALAAPLTGDEFVSWATLHTEGEIPENVLRDMYLPGPLKK